MDRLKLLGKNKIGWTKVRVKSNERERVRVQGNENKIQKSIKSFSSQLSWCTYYRRKWIQVLTTVLVILCGWFFLSLFIFTQKNAKLGSLSHFDELNIFCGSWSFSWLCLSLSLPNRPRTPNIKRQKLEMKERSWNFNWSIFIVVRYST